MKKLHTGGKLLKGLILAGLLASCQNEDVLNPQSAQDGSKIETNAKTNAEIRLTKDGSNNLLYITTGRFTGRLYKVNEPNYYTHYTYDDSSGDLWITAKRISKSNGSLDYEAKYHIVNNRCIESDHKPSNKHYIYKYNEVGRLDEISCTLYGSTTKRLFQYDYISATGAERLKKITFSSNATAANPNGIAYKYINYFYDPGAGTTLDKYPLNPQFSDLDKYLPIFGKFSEVLVKYMTTELTSNTSQMTPYYQFLYTLNANGYITNRTCNYHPAGYGNDKFKETTNTEMKFSTGWQGI